MNKETLKALRASIEHWEENAEATTLVGLETKSDGCALCQMFVEKNNTCDGCPVEATAGFGHCENTPWMAARRAHLDWAWADYNADKVDVDQICRWQLQFQEAAQAEVTFLQSLWPAGAEVDQ